MSAWMDTTATDGNELSVVTFDTFETAFPISASDARRERRRFMTLFVNENEGRACGAMGYVSPARNARGDRFALKRLRTLDDADAHNSCLAAGRIAAFREEYRNQLVLSHLKGFPTLFGYGTIENTPAILMEWIPGVTLGAARRDLARVPGPAALRVPGRVVAALGVAVLDVLSAVEHLEHPLVHRDLSVGNIMLRCNRHPVAEQAAHLSFDVCLIDFGSSTIAEPESETRFTMLTDVWRNGTPEYAAPEMLTRDIPDVDRLRTSVSIDVYALCSVLFELYAGYTPYRVYEHPGTSPYLLKQQELTECPPLIVPTDAELVAALTAGIRPRQEDRITASALRARLAAWLVQTGAERRPIPTHGTSSRTRATVETPSHTGSWRPPTDPVFEGARAQAFAAEAAARGARWQASVPGTQHTVQTARASAASGHATPASRSMRSTQRAATGRGTQPSASGQSASRQPASNHAISRRVLVGGVILAAGAVCAGSAWGITRLLEGISPYDESTIEPEPTDDSTNNPKPTTQDDIDTATVPYEGPLFAAADDHTGRWGYLGTDGTWIIEPTFEEEPGSFYDNLAAAADPETGRWGHIDRTGSWAVEPTFAATGTFANGLAPAEDAANRRWGFIDTSGTWKVSPQFSAATAFSAGLAAVQQPEDEADSARRRYGQLWGYIDTTGTWSIGPSFAGAGPFGSEGLAPAAPTAQSWSFIDATGTTAFDGVWNQAKAFAEGLAAVRDGATKRWGFINSSGSLTIAQEFLDVGSFANGRAPAQDPSSKLWGFIDTTGTWQVDPSFEHLGSLVDGLAAAEDATGITGYVDASGTWTISDALSAVPLPSEA